MSLLILLSFNIKVHSMIIYFKKRFCFIFALFLIAYISTSYTTELSLQEEAYLAHIQEGMQRYHDEGEFDYLTEEQISSYFPMFLSMYRKEKELSSEYYQAVTGMPPRFLAFQMILKELYRLIDRIELEDYEFLRAKFNDFKHLNEFFVTYPDLLRWNELIQPCYKIYDKYQLLDQDGHMPRDILDTIEEPLKSIIQKEIDEIQPLLDKQKTFISDTDSIVSDHLISASFSMETSSPMDSAHYVFITGSGMSSDKEKDNFIYDKLMPFAGSVNMSEESFKALLEDLVSRCPFSREGILMQIFIPKEKAKEMMFVALAGGFLADQQYLNLIHDGYAATSGSEDLEKFYNYFEYIRLTENFDIDENYQLRLLADCLRSDETKIFRYTTIPQEQLDTYQDYIRTSLGRMKAEG
jgi:hypothetical protein